MLFNLCDEFGQKLFLKSCPSWRHQPSKSSEVFWVINQVSWDLNSGIIGLQNALMKIPFQHFEHSDLEVNAGKIWFGGKCRGKSKKYEPRTFHVLCVCPLSILVSVESFALFPGWVIPTGYGAWPNHWLNHVGGGVGEDDLVKEVSTRGQVPSTWGPSSWWWY